MARGGPPKGMKMRKQHAASFRAATVKGAVVFSPAEHLSFRIFRKAVIFWRGTRLTARREENTTEPERGEVSGREAVCVNVSVAAAGPWSGS